MVNYNKSYIYKLCCNDINVKDLYVGSTTNFKQRKRLHRSACKTETNKSYNVKVYKFIRENGGFENWSMILITEFNCNNKLELLREERKHIDELQSSLNCKKPTRTRKEYQIECLKPYQKQYRIDNKEKIKEKNKKYNLEKLGCRFCKCDISKKHFKEHCMRKKHLKNV